MLGTGVKTAEPAVAQNGQVCEAKPFALVSAHKWNWPARNKIASTKMKNRRARFPLMYLVRRSLGKKGWLVKQFSQSRSANNQCLCGLRLSAFSVEICPLARFDKARPVEWMPASFAFEHCEFCLA